MLLAMAPAVAQNLKFDIVKFELNQLDGTASNKNYEKIDGSGNRYAIIKVRSTDGDEGLGEFMFNFNSLKSIVEDKGDELWVYVQKNAKIVTISREGYTPLRNFDLKMTLQAGKTYNMEITYDRVEKVVKKELRMQMVSFELIPAVEGAIVMYKKEGEDAYEEFGKTDKFGNVAKNLKFGTYEYQVIRSQYYTTQGIIKLSSTEVHTEKITLKPKFSTITLSTNEGADIYVNNELKGRGSWTGPLDAGDYVVECKQQNHRSTSQSITVEANADKTIELQKPTPITGFVSVISSPSGATVLIDGKERGKAPCNISDVLVGNRKVTLSMSGYTQATKEIVVKEGEVADVNITLSNTTASNIISYTPITKSIHISTGYNLEDIYKKGKEAYDNNNYTDAVEYYREAAEKGHAAAQFNIGCCYFNGQGIEKNLTEAVKWFKKAAEQGYANAQCNLGYCYYFGKGVEKNLTESAKWYKKAAEQGNATAQDALKKLSFPTPPTTPNNGGNRVENGVYTNLGNIYNQEVIEHNSNTAKEGEVADVNLTLKNTATSNTSAAKAKTTTTPTTSENGEENKKVDGGEIYEVKVYSNCYDGYLNVRAEPSSKSQILGTLPNGPDGAELLGAEGKWSKVRVNGVVGYIWSADAQSTPTEPVFISASDVVGEWMLYNDNSVESFYRVKSNGKFEFFNAEIEETTQGTWHLSRYAIVFKFVNPDGDITATVNGKKMDFGSGVIYRKK